MRMIVSRRLTGLFMAFSLGLDALLKRLLSIFLIGMFKTKATAPP